MKGKGSEVLRGSDWIRRDKDRGRKSKRGLGMANTKIGEGCTKILRTGKLLSLVYRRICNGGKAVT